MIIFRAANTSPKVPPTRARRKSYFPPTRNTIPPAKDDEFLRDLHGNRQNRETNETSIENTVTMLGVLERSLPKLGFDVLTTEMEKSKNKRKRRRYRDVISTVAIAGGSEALIQDDETGLGRSSVALSSTVEGGTTTRHWKNRRHRRCKNRLACLHFGDRDTDTAPAINSEENDAETRNERMNDYRQIPQQEIRNRYLEKQLLVGNRSIELFRQELVPVVAAGEASLSPTVDPSSIEIGDILADTRSRRPHVVTEQSVPKILLRQAEKRIDKTAVTTSNSGKRIMITVTKYEKQKTNGEPNINEGSSRLNDPNDRLLQEQSRPTSSDRTISYTRKKDHSIVLGRTERYGSLQYEIDRIEKKKEVDRSRVERKYDSRKTTRSEENSKRSSLDSTVLASIYLPIEDHTDIHESLAVLLSRLLDTLKSATTLGKSHVFLQDLDATKNWLDSENTADDLCQKWLDSKEKLEEAFLGSHVCLPACPCQYPSSIFYDDKIWDEHQKKYFRWRDVNRDAERMDVYKPGATYCVRSLLSQESGNAAAQHCCYDRQRRLLTRGSGAGTPNFVSPEVSAELHERIDILPWRLCKGDFTRFNRVRPPNNDNRCKTNPDDDEYRSQINSTKYY